VWRRVSGYYCNACVGVLSFWNGEFVHLEELQNTQRAELQYVVSRPIVAYYYTSMVGDPKSPPTLLASEGFNGTSVVGKSLFSRRNFMFLI
jgi:hypothetical protein